MKPTKLRTSIGSLTSMGFSNCIYEMIQLFKFPSLPDRIWRVIPRKRNRQNCFWQVYIPPVYPTVRHLKRAKRSGPHGGLQVDKHKVTNWRDMLCGMNDPSETVSYRGMAQYRTLYRVILRQRNDQNEMRNAHVY